MGFFSRILKNLGRFFGRRSKRGFRVVTGGLANGILTWDGAELAVLKNQDYPVTVRIPVRRTYGTSGPISVSVRTTPGTPPGGAQYGLDYQFKLLPGKTINPGAITLSWPDSNIDPSGTEARYVDIDILVPLLKHTTDTSFGLTLESPTGGATLPNGPTFGTATLTVTIKTEPGAAGLVGFLQRTFQRPEATLATFEVHRTAGSVGAVAVDWETEDGDVGESGSAYIHASGKLTWSGGETGPKTFQVALLDVPFDQDFRIRLSNPTNGVVISTQTNPARVDMIHESATSPGVIAHEVVNVQKAESTVLTLKARRLGGVVGAVGCTYSQVDGTALAGTHYTAVSSTLAWAAGDDADKTWTITLGAVPAGHALRFSSLLTLPTGGVTLLDGYDLADVVIFDNGIIPPSPIYDVLADDTYEVAEDSFEDESYYGSQDVHVVVMSAIDSGVIGIGGGTGSFGGGQDLVNGDDNLFASSFARFQAWETVEEKDYGA